MKMKFDFLNRIKVQKKIIFYFFYIGFHPSHYDWQLLSLQHPFPVNKSL